MNAARRSRPARSSGAGDVDDVDATTSARGHVPILPDACVEALGLRAGATVVDCTAGGGGHLERFALAVGETGRVIGLDRDARAFADDAAGGVAARYPQVELHRAPFSQMKQVLDGLGLNAVDAVFADLGVSSFQLDEGDRGFSFRFDAPLDMRMDQRTGETVAELIARLDEEDLANVIYRFGEEHRSRRVARLLKERRPQTTGELADAVFRALGPGTGDKRRIHPATKTFQALRIAVNGELDELSTLLSTIPGVLTPEGRAALLTFHSLEDRLVKIAFKEAGFTPVHKKPVVADEDEIRDNPRSRSAKLRAAIWGLSARLDKKARYKQLAEAQRAQRDDDHRDDDDDGDDGDDGEEERHDTQEHGGDP